jgi:hypothetical protein
MVYGAVSAGSTDHRPSTVNGVVDVYALAVPEMKNSSVEYPNWPRSNVVVNNVGVPAPLVIGPATVGTGTDDSCAAVDAADDPASVSPITDVTVRITTTRRRRA